ncbi:MAG: DUF3599 family protein [Porcipelethomonas sp.]
MSFEKMLDHKCEIYHLKKSDMSPGYGLPPAESFEYGETPDVENVSCHFGIGSLSSSVEQQRPQNNLDERIKLTLPADTDIRINDRIVNCENGMEYTAELPRNIRGHHIFVYIHRISQQRAL